AYAAFDANELDKGEALWARAQEVAANIDSRYGQASQVLEAALFFDATRADMRHLLADVLYARALLAERERKGAARDDLLARMGLYDEKNERKRRWNEPAHVTIISEPPAGVVVQAYIADVKYRRLGPARELGETPIAEIELPRGAHLLTF